MHIKIQIFEDLHKAKIQIKPKRKIQKLQMTISNLKNAKYECFENHTICKKYR